MFAARYFAPRYFAPRYFPEVGLTGVEFTFTGTPALVFHYATALVSHYGTTFTLP